MTITLHNVLLNTVQETSGTVWVNKVYPQVVYLGDVTVSVGAGSLGLTGAIALDKMNMPITGTLTLTGFEHFNGYVNPAPRAITTSGLSVWIGDFEVPSSSLTLSPTVLAGASISPPILTTSALAFTGQTAVSFFGPHGQFTSYLPFVFDGDENKISSLSQSASGTNRGAVGSMRMPALATMVAYTGARADQDLAIIGQVATGLCGPTANASQTLPAVMTMASFAGTTFSATMYAVEQSSTALTGNVASLAAVLSLPTLAATGRRSLSSSGSMRILPLYMRSVATGSIVAVGEMSITLPRQVSTNITGVSADGEMTLRALTMSTTALSDASADFSASLPALAMADTVVRSFAKVVGRLDDSVLRWERPTQ